MKRQKELSYLKTCLSCNNEFVAKRINKRYCSLKCYHQSPQYREYHREYERLPIAKERRVKYLESLKKTVAEHYDYCPYCKLFGYPQPPLEAMDVHHDNGGGNRFRKSNGNFNIYNWIIKNNFPKDLSVVCPTHHRMLDLGLIR